MNFSVTRRGGSEDFVTRRRDLERCILAQLGVQGAVTQRSLAADLGIALGLANLLIRGLEQRGWVRIERVSSRRVRYLITPAGALAKARLARQHFLSSISFYSECKKRMRERFSVAVAEIAQRNLYTDSGPAVAFWGGGEAAELAYLALGETSLCLLGLVETSRLNSALRVAVYQPSDLSGASLTGQDFSLLMVMPFQPQKKVLATLADRGVPRDRVFWL